MKVLLVSDYFYPFTPGGAEWSVYELAQAFKNKGVEAIIATLNYGAAQRETYKGVEVIRLPFAKKLNGSRKVINPFWQSNPIFWVTSTYHLIKVIRREKPDIVHIHGKFLIPGAIISGFITRRPVVVTIRDKQLLCPIGKCFFEKDRTRACSLDEYIFTEIPWFFKNYHKSRNPLKFIYIFLGSIWARMAILSIKLFLKRANTITAISNSQKEYLENNGVKKVKVIYNTGNFRFSLSKVRKEKKVLYAGKLSKGKGGEVLLDAINSLAREGDIKFLFAGSVDLKDKVEEKLKDPAFKRSTQFLGSVNYSDLATLINNSSAVVMPSIYPEAFGRVTLEALCAGVPAVVSDTGALPEIIDDKKTGRVVNVDADSLREAIIDVVENESTYKDNIKKEYPKLKNKFYEEPTDQYIKLYEGLLK